LPRKSDVTAVARIFEQDHESAEAAATAAIEALDAARRDRLTFAVAVQGLPVAIVYHGFETRQEAVNWCKRTAIDVAGLSVGVIPVYNKDAVLERHKVASEELAAKNKPEPVPAWKPRKRAA
jgi:hypothetical protein